MTCRPKSVLEYISSFPEKTQSRLRQLRRLIRKNAPQATEGISYGMPAYSFLGRPLIYFAAYKHHIGLYALPATHEAFAKALAVYKHGKGSVQFPLDKPLPLKLVEKMLIFRLRENRRLLKSEP